MSENLNNKTAKIKIEFKSWLGKAALEIEAGSTKEAVEKAVKDGANLYGANLDGANLRCANLRCAKHNDKKLWQVRPILQLGCCGSCDRITTIIFYADKSEPMVYCGCFSGTIEQFEEKIHETHSGTFHEYEYMAMVDYIKSIRKYQLEIEDEK